MKNIYLHTEADICVQLSVIYQRGQKQQPSNRLVINDTWQQDINKLYKNI